MTITDLFWNCFCLGLPLTGMLLLGYGLLYGFRSILEIPNKLAHKYLEWWLHRG